MKDVTPSRSHHPFLRIAFFIAGFFFALWEVRQLWLGLADAARRLRNRR